MKSKVQEQWVDLPKKFYHRDTYQISSNGQIRNKHTGHIIHQRTNGDGYKTVCLGHKTSRSVHRMVCETFLGEPPSDTHQVNHIDCNRKNNNISNLEWVTPSENIKWGVTHGNVKPLKGLVRAVEVNKKPVRLVENGLEFDSLQSCGEYLGVTRGNISRCLTGERKGQRIKGYHVEYVEGGKIYE